MTIIWYSNDLLFPVENRAQETPKFLTRTLFQRSETKRLVTILKSLQFRSFNPTTKRYKAKHSFLNNLSTETLKFLRKTVTKLSQVENSLVDSIPAMKFDNTLDSYHNTVLTIEGNDNCPDCIVSILGVSPKQSLNFLSQLLKTIEKNSIVFLVSDTTITQGRRHQTEKSLADSSHDEFSEIETNGFYTKPDSDDDGSNSEDCYYKDDYSLLHATSKIILPGSFDSQLKVLGIDELHSSAPSYVVTPISDFQNLSVRLFQPQSVYDVGMNLVTKRETTLKLEGVSISSSRLHQAFQIIENRVGNKLVERDTVLESVLRKRLATDSSPSHTSDKKLDSNIDPTGKDEPINTKETIVNNKKALFAIDQHLFNNDYNGSETNSDWETRTSISSMYTSTDATVVDSFPIEDASFPKVTSETQLSIISDFSVNCSEDQTSKVSTLFEDLKSQANDDTSTFSHFCLHDVENVAKVPVISELGQLQQQGLGDLRVDKKNNYQLTQDSSRLDVKYPQSISRPFLSDLRASESIECGHHIETFSIKTEDDEDDQLKLMLMQTPQRDNTEDFRSHEKSAFSFEKQHSKNQNECKEPIDDASDPSKENIDEMYKNFISSFSPDSKSSDHSHEEVDYLVPHKRQRLENSSRVDIKTECIQSYKSQEMFEKTEEKSESITTGQLSTDHSSLLSSLDLHVENIAEISNPIISRPGLIYSKQDENSGAAIKKKVADESPSSSIHGRDLVRTKLKSAASQDGHFQRLQRRRDSVSTVVNSKGLQTNSKQPLPTSIGCSTPRFIQPQQILQLNSHNTPHAEIPKPFGEYTYLSNSINGYQYSTSRVKSPTILAQTSQFPKDGQALHYQSSQVSPNIILPYTSDDTLPPPPTGVIEKIPNSKYYRFFFVPTASIRRSSLTSTLNAKLKVVADMTKTYIDPFKEAHSRKQGVIVKGYKPNVQNAITHVQTLFSEYAELQRDERREGQGKIRQNWYKNETSENERKGKLLGNN